MRLKLRDLWTCHGVIGRGPFLAWGLALFGVKYNLDRLVIHHLSGRVWSLFDYFDQPIPGMRLFSPAQDTKEFVALLVCSIPFLWAGIALCLKRLESARLPDWLAVLFVAPIVKWFLFVALALVPERKEREEKKAGVMEWLPDSKWGSAALAVAISVAMVLGAAVLCTMWLREYGWALFVGAPFAMGFFSAIIYGARQRRSLWESQVVACAAVTVAGATLLAVAVEGAVCLMMAAPLAYAIALLGALAGHGAQAGLRPKDSTQLMCAAILALPLMAGTEALRTDTPPVFKVVTSVEVNAPVEVVWKHVVEFSELPPPQETIFKLGIAYPMRAEIRGRGVGAVRNCVFSTGPFVEPIQVWDEPRLLKFSVTSNPEPLEEWTPYRHIHPAHLDGFMVSEQGQFFLTPLPGGRTRLEGTTWYRHGLWPAKYWQVWSDQIIHTIHLRVLTHVKKLAESDRRSSE